MEACRPGAPGAESQCLIVCRLLSFHCFWLTAHFWFVLSVVTCPALMRFASLRPNFPCWPNLRTPSLWASPVSLDQPVLVAGQLLLFRAHFSPPQFRQHPQRLVRRPRPCREVAASLLRSASLRASSPRTRTRSRSPAPLPKRAPRAPRRSSSVASGLRGSVALAESGLVTGLATKCCPPVPPPQLRLSRVARALHAASTESQPSAVASGPSAPTAPAPEAPRVTEPSSNSDNEWDALLDAHGLTGTAAAVAQPAVAAGASRRARDKRRRRQRKASKRSMWRDI